ncbi:ABC transporter substrate-binding protein [Phytoactinopolyspora halotolerans]|uniref:Sugar ABC transporter substrate-binding protein n=1 Tax=Phytoactinopolyspora halotolerans TaxID=1981512 RepID=A0A6L9SFR5_9ACTN|nr:sugar ABC transporter substrate-binding protein [Phytoactinopolyspora halotolerans]NEE03478.1 sugar ABC transporter substrate-binding protein [Phytoactinopolyspora halotolerans]
MSTPANKPLSMSRRGFMRGVLGTAAGTGMLGALSACGDDGGSSSSSGEGDSGRLVFWHNYTQEARVNFMREVADRFEESHPGTTVEIEVVPFPQFPTKWPAAQTAGNLPDVTTVLPEHAVSMWQAGALHPMDPVLEELGGSSAFVPGLLDKAAAYEDQHILLPHYVHNRLLAHRTDILADAGVSLPERPTWDEVLTAAQATTKEPDQFGWMLKLSAADTGGGYLLWMLTHSAGGRFFDADGTAMLDTPEVKRATEFLVEIGHTASGPGQVNYNINDNFSLINAGTTVLAEVSGAEIGIAAVDAPDIADKLATTFMPTDVRPGNLIGAVSLALPKGKNPTLAQEFAAFLYAEENYVPFLHTIPLFMFPALASANSPEFFAEPTIAKYEATAQQTLAGVEEGSPPGFEDGPNPYTGPVFNSHAIEQMLQNILVGGADVDSALATANQTVQATLDDISSRLG